MEKIYQFEYNGAKATVILPENGNGEWIWKTEFFYEFDEAERALLEMGYARVYYAISNRYGSDKAVRLMDDFYHYVVREFGLRDRCHLFGFSRGGLYAFNFARRYPERVASVYLDAPVLDVRSWPPQGSHEHDEMLEEYGLTEETFPAYRGAPIDNLGDFFEKGLPLLLVAGDADEVVPLAENAGILLDYCKENGIIVESIIKPGCKHHPHSLTDVTPIIAFVKRHSK